MFKKYLFLSVSLTAILLFVYVFTHLVLSNDGGVIYCARGSFYNSYLQKCICPSGGVIYDDRCVSSRSFCSITMGDRSVWRSETQSCECLLGYVADKDNRCVWGSNYCRETFGDGSVFNRETKSCECVGNSKLVDGQCQSEESYDDEFEDNNDDLE